MSDHKHIRVNIGEAVDDAPVDVGDILDSLKLNTKRTWSSV